MKVRQLEIDLWQSLSTALLFPQTACLQQLCSALESAIAQQPVAEQLRLGAEVLSQLSQVYASRVELLLSAWERQYNPTEPVIDLEGCVELFVQSLHLNVEDFFEPPEPNNYPENRHPRTDCAMDGSLAQQVNKLALLQVVDELLPEAATQWKAPLLSNEQDMQMALDIAHDEDVSRWSEAIARWMQHNSNSEAVSLVQLQQALRMPLVEVWLGLLLGKQEYKLEQRGDFYDSEVIFVNMSAATPSLKM